MWSRALVVMVHHASMFCNVGSQGIPMRLLVLESPRRHSAASLGGSERERARSEGSEGPWPSE
eukprot:1429473-Pyramimonas_sp.AAC.1